MIQISLQDLVMCKYQNCKKIFQKAVILTCGGRCCQEHVESMKIEPAETEESSKNEIKCFFCAENHSIPEKGFPNDEVIGNLLKIDFSTKQGEAKNSLKNLKETIEKINNLNDEDYFYDYFKNIESNILSDKEELFRKINCHYEGLIEKLKKSKIDCCAEFKKSRDEETKMNFDFIDKIKIKIEEEKYEHDLLTLNGTDEKWSKIKNECDSLKLKIENEFNALKTQNDKNGKKFSENLVSYNIIKFIPARFRISDLKLGEILGKLLIDSYVFFNSKILNEKSLVEMKKICSLENSSLKLIYRGSDHGFESKSFHSKCDNIPKTLTVVKTSDNYIFGGYTNVSWNIMVPWKTDQNAFLYSLINEDNKPSLMKCKQPEFAVFNKSTYGPIFGVSDLHISNNSNKNKSSYSNLGYSYEKLNNKSFIAGTQYFQTVEIEVFQVN